MSTLTQQLKDTTDLDEKLRLIDEMVAKASTAVKSGNLIAPSDPALMFTCDGCE